MELDTKLRTQILTQANFYGQKFTKLQVHVLMGFQVIQLRKLHFLLIRANQKTTDFGHGIPTQ